MSPSGTGKVTITIDRRWLDIPFSMFRWLKTYAYTIDATTGTLTQHHQALTIMHAYPDDLTVLRTPTVALTAPMQGQPDQDFFGETPGTEIYAMEIYGFVVGRADDHASKTYRDRLLNDLYRLLVDVARIEGVALFSQAAPSDPAYGRLEVINARGRKLPANTFDVPAERYKFILEFEIGFN